MFGNIRDLLGEKMFCKDGTTGRMKLGIMKLPLFQQTKAQLAHLNMERIHFKAFSALKSNDLKLFLFDFKGFRNTY